MLLATVVSLVVVALVGCQAGDGATRPSGGTTATPTPKLVWSEDFTGAAGSPPDARHWSFAEGGDGWGNNELECYTNAPGNVALDGSGHLVITAIKQPGHICSDGRSNDYTSARILTQKKFSTTYGRIEVRAKLPNTSGTWPAFWALGDAIETVGWPRAGEIDIVETTGDKPNKVVGTLHGPKSDDSPFLISVSKQSTQDLSAEFHVYAADWTTDRITFSMDGEPYGSVTREQVTAAGGSWVWDKGFYLLLNLAVGGDFPGPPDADAPWPQSYTIDWVRVLR